MHSRKQINFMTQIKWLEPRVKTATFITTQPKPFFFVPHALAKVGDTKTYASVCLSVTKTWTRLISSEVWMIEHYYLACIVLVTSPFNWHHAVTFNLSFDLLQGQICCHAGWPQYSELACDRPVLILDGSLSIFWLIIFLSYMSTITGLRWLYNSAKCDWCYMWSLVVRKTCKYDLLSED